MLETLSNLKKKFKKSKKSSQELCGRWRAEPRSIWCCYIWVGIARICIRCGTENLSSFFRWTVRLVLALSGVYKGKKVQHEGSFKLKFWKRKRSIIFFAVLKGIAFWIVRMVPVMPIVQAGLYGLCQRMKGMRSIFWVCRTKVIKCSENEGLISAGHGIVFGNPKMVPGVRIVQGGSWA